MQFHSYCAGSVSNDPKLDVQSTHHSTCLIPRVDDARERQDTADPRRDVRSVVTAVVRVMELSDQLQLESSVADGLAPHLPRVSTYSGRKPA